MICFCLFVIEQSCSFIGPCKEQISLTITVTIDRMLAAEAARPVFDRFDKCWWGSEHLQLDVAFGTILPAQVTAVGHVENLNRANQQAKKKLSCLSDWLRLRKWLEWIDSSSFAEPIVFLMRAMRSDIYMIDRWLSCEQRAQRIVLSKANVTEENSSRHEIRWNEGLD